MNIYTKNITIHSNIISYIRALLPPTYTPPQVDEYRCKNRRARAAVGKKRDYTSSVIRVRWPIDGASQEKDGKRKPDKTKPDKTKRENDKGLKKAKPPKRDGLAPIL